MANTQTCYFPDGSISPRDTPCHSSSTGASACCAYLDVCLDNHLCLSQGGPEVISRGSCTDETWRSPECSQYCSDVLPNTGVGIYRINIDHQAMFCCGQVNTSNDTCMDSTKGSRSPFSIEAGLVIFNRTSGSTKQNNTDTITVTATTITTTAASASESTPIHTSPSTPSRRDAVTGLGIGLSLVTALLMIALRLLWVERKRKRNLSKEIQAWEEKNAELQNAVNLGGGQQHQPSRPVNDSIPDELNHRPHLPVQLEGSKPSEAGGAPIHELT